MTNDGKYDILMNAGDFLAVPMEFFDDSNVSFNLENRTVRFIIKRDIDDTDVDALVYRTSLINFNTNIYAMELNTSDTINLEGEYYYQLLFSFPSDPNNIHFRLKGTINIEKSLLESV